MERKLFGTDGIRGKANQYPIVPDLLIRVAMASAQLFMNPSRKMSQDRGEHRHTVVIGKDTRQSGYMIESALTAGFTAMGYDVLHIGPMPTPAVSIMTRALRADLGVMISASHNPYQDNGIKFFNAEGLKLTDAQEKEIENLALSSNFEDEFNHSLSSSSVGKVRHIDAQGRYIEYAKATLPRGIVFDDLKIVVDCAHGAAYRVAPQILWELGATVISIGVQPDGVNINDGFGATSPQKLQEAVLTHKADLGIALDGDADRLIMVDELGQVVDGDNLMALIVQSWQESGRLKGGQLVATQMSNIGLERYLETIGIGLIRTKVGDRYVLEAMQSSGCNVGGEQSGHLILTDYSCTGDGLIAALQVLTVLKKKGKPFSKIAHVFTPVPQLLRNVRIANKAVLNQDNIRLAIDEAEKEIKKSKGRLLVRPSGTEPLVRIMAESDDQGMLETIVSQVEEVFKAAV